MIFKSAECESQSKEFYAFKKNLLHNLIVVFIEQTFYKT